MTTITIEPKQKGRTYISKVKLSVKWVLCLFNINTLQNLNKIATTIFMHAATLLCKQLQCIALQ